MTISTRARRIAAGLALCLTSASRGGELLVDSLKSTALGAELPFTTYLPDAYKDGGTKLPVAYLLHGAGGNKYERARKGGAVEPLDGLIRRGLMRPTIAIMPTAGPDSWWTDGASAKAETAMITELMPYVEGKYRVGTDRNSRAIAGLSMGAYGALNLSLHYPSKFCAAGIISPAIYDPLPPETSASRRATQCMRDGKFDEATWKALTYPAHLEKYAQAPQKVPMWIVSGDHDFLGIAVMSTNLYWRVLKIQPKLSELRVIDGDHEWMTFRDALPNALQYMERQWTKLP